MSLPTQSQVMRAVKAALAPAKAMGLTVSGYKVSFSQGIPSVDVTLAQDSAQPSPVNTGGETPMRIARVLGWSQGDAEAMAAVYISSEAL